MNYQYMKSYDAAMIMKEVNNDPSKLLNIPSDYLGIRDVIVTNYDDKAEKYTRDLKLAIKLYEYMINEINVPLRVTSNPEFWIFLQVRVVPDIVGNRWGNDNYDHFFLKPRRIWLSTLWWYIHLNWDGDPLTTYEKLLLCNTDTIFQLVERTGGGYNIDLYKKIMQKYTDLLKNESPTERNLFRRVMILNTSYLQTIIPEFYINGIEGYVNMLFETARNDTWS